MPLPIQAISLIVIPRYFVDALRGIILKDAPLAAIWPDLVALAALGLLYNLIAAHKTKKGL
jgi:ABC-2 type transport system permease protein